MNKVVKGFWFYNRHHCLYMHTEHFTISSFLSLLNFFCTVHRIESHLPFLMQMIRWYSLC